TDRAVSCHRCRRVSHGSHRNEVSLAPPASPAEPHGRPRRARPIAALGKLSNGPLGLQAVALRPEAAVHTDCNSMSRFRLLALMPLALLLGGCDFVVLYPAGDVAWQQRDLVIIATVLMLLIIVPVMALTVFFAWKYRAANQAADYDPDWNHSTYL